MKQADVDTILKILFSNHKEYIKKLLRDHGLPVSGTKDELDVLVRAQIKASVIDPSTIVALVNEIEGWGDQRIYLFDVAASEKKLWSDINQVKKMLQSRDASTLLNAGTPIVMPDKLTLTTINVDKETVRFVWVVVDRSYERLSDHDSYDRDKDLVLRAYKEHVSRNIIAFDWNLISDRAMLLVKRAHNDTESSELFGEIMGQIGYFIDIDSLREIRLAKAIQNLENSAEVRVQRGVSEAINGLKADYRAKNRKDDAKKYANYHSSKKALGQHTGFFGNFYWNTTEELKKEMHTNLYSQGNSILIFGQHPEDQVKYVIDRIIAHL